MLQAAQFGEGDWKLFSVKEIRPFLKLSYKVLQSIQNNQGLKWEKRKKYFSPPLFLSITWRNIGKQGFFQLKTAPQKGRGKGQREKKETPKKWNKQVTFHNESEWEKHLPKQYGIKALNNFANLSLWTQYTDTMLVYTT